MCIECVYCVCWMKVPNIGSCNCVGIYCRLTIVVVNDRTYCFFLGGVWFSSLLCNCQLLATFKKETTILNLNSQFHPIIKVYADMVVVGRAAKLFKLYEADILQGIAFLYFSSILDILMGSTLLLCTSFHISSHTIKWFLPLLWCYPCIFGICSVVMATSYQYPLVIITVGSTVM